MNDNLIEAIFTAANRHEVHKHRCTGTTPHIWEHKEECSGDDEAHQCPVCGASAEHYEGGGWLKYFGDEPVTVGQARCCQNLVFDFLEATVPKEILDSARAFYKKKHSAK